MSPENDMIVACASVSEPSLVYEWILFHRSIGFDHFVLVTNEWGRLELEGVLSKAGFDSVVTVVVVLDLGEEHHKPIWNEFANRCKWIIFLEISEYVVIKIGRDVKRYLMAFEEYAALVVQVLMFDKETGVLNSPKNLGEFLYSRYFFQPSAISIFHRPTEVEFVGGWSSVSEHFSDAPCAMHIHITRIEQPIDLSGVMEIDQCKRNVEKYFSPELSGVRNNRIFGFIHVAIVNNWNILLASQLWKIKISGLEAVTSKIWLGIVGAGSEVRATLNWLPSNVEIAFLEPDVRRYEFPTLEFLQRHCLSVDSYVWYSHLKGVFRQDPEQQAWRNKMEEFVIFQYETAIAKLDSGFDVAGAFGSNDPRWAIPGNFWWATSSHIRTLPDITLLDQTNRWEAEHWIAMNGTNAFYWLDCGNNAFRNFRLMGSTVAAGLLTSNGYHGWLRIPVTYPRGWRAEVVISAHSPSFVEIEVFDEIVIFAFICQSGSMAGSWLVQFFINGTFVGGTRAVGKRTEGYRLGVGRYLLESRLVLGEMWGAHSVWAIWSPNLGSYAGIENIGENERCEFVSVAERDE